MQTRSGARVSVLMLFFLALVLILTACAQPSSPSPAAAGEAEGLQVVATTTIVADIVKQVGGGAVEVFTLLPVGADPHAFEPSPRDIARVADADMVFMNGAGLEAFMEPLLQNAGGSARVVSLSEDLPLLESPQAEDLDHEAEETHDPASGDPHVWMDPNNILFWVNKIESALKELDPGNAAEYEANAAAYSGELEELDAWVREQVEKIPPENRKLVTDHQTFNYFANRYGFEQTGALIPSFSSSAEPSAQELAALQDAIHGQGVRAIFIGSTVNPALASQVAEDMDIQLVTLYTGSLTEPGGDAGTYLDFIRYNVEAITGALQ